MPFLPGEHNEAGNAAFEIVRYHWTQESVEWKLVDRMTAQRRCCIVGQLRRLAREVENFSFSSRTRLVRAAHGRAGPGQEKSSMTQPAGDHGVCRPRHAAISAVYRVFFSMLF